MSKFDELLCLQCPLPDCNEHSSECLIRIKRGGSVFDAIDEPFDAVNQVLNVLKIRVDRIDCSHEQSHKYGFTKGGRQRWKCPCGITFVRSHDGYVDGRSENGKFPRRKIIIRRKPRDKSDRYFLKMRELGRCGRCGKPSHLYMTCEECRRKKRNWAVKRSERNGVRLAKPLPNG